MSERPIIPGWPSVTQVLHAHGFYDLYDDPNIDSQAAMRRGRLVDSACNQIALHGLSTEIVWHTTTGEEVKHPECEPYIDAYREWFATRRIKLIDCQFEVRHETERYIGHPDQLLEVDDDPFLLLSLKTGALQLWNALQEAAYIKGMLAMARWAGVRIRRAALELKRNGKYTYRYFDDPFDFDNWTILVRAFHVKGKYFQVAA